MQTTFLNAWKEREETEEIIYTNGQTPEGILAQGVSLIEAYLKEPPPANIISVETELLAPLHNSRGEYLEKPLLTIMDLVLRDEQGTTVREIKTSSRTYGDYEAVTSLQATCYLNNAYELFSEPVRFEFTVLVKAKTPKVQHLETNRGEEDFSRLGDIVETIDRAVTAGIFYPVESPLNCSTCSYRQACREWVSTRETKPATTENSHVDRDVRKRRVPLPVGQGG